MAKSALPSPQDIAAKQIRNVSAATDSYRKGVAAVQTAPGVLAAQKRDKYLQGVQDNVDKWASNVASVPLSTWVQAATDKGATRLSSGITAAQNKIVSFWTNFLPFLSNVQSQVNSMPSDTFDQRVAKMVANATALHGFKNRR